MVPDATTRRTDLARQQPARPAAEPRWQVRLLGAVEAFDGVQRLDRFPSRAVAALLARLALAPDRAHAREELVELLWPGVALAVGRNRLRQVLSTLKSMLEPPGVPGAVVVLADRLSVRAAPAALGCDAVRFQQLVRAGQSEQAAALYRSELMPGYFDEWIHDERQRLAALHERLLATPLSVRSATPAAPAAGQGWFEPRPSADAAPGLSSNRSSNPPTSLPTYLTRLFGADLAVARLRSQVRAHRLVTLLGPGGSGKTRLAVEVAQALREHTPWVAEAAAPAFDRIGFVPLMACQQVAQMHAAIARALQLPSAGADDAEGLGLALAGQRVLLVLDNFEQLVGLAAAVAAVASEEAVVAAEGAESAVAALLSALPLLHLLVTSRRALGLDGEVSVAADPLALPAADATLSGAGANAAVALFVDRARAVRADFHLTVRNHAAVVALVRSLQGMPLAIELAASRVRSFSPADMVQLLGAGDAAHLALLSRSGPRAGHDPRHASMAQVIVWSWRLLDAPAQQLLAALTCFAGDAGADGLAAVLGDTLPAVAARLDDLASHSLLRAVAAEPARFGIVEPVREFVQAQLTPAVRAEMDAAVRAWLLHWARVLGPVPAPARVAPELRTVHAVLASASAAPRESAELTLALRTFWESEGLPAALQTALEQALPLLGPSDNALRGELHELLAYLRFEAGFVTEAQAHAAAALAAAGQHAARRARALVRCAWVELATGRGEGDAGPQTVRLLGWLHEALALAQGCGDREAQARALHQMAVIASQVQQDWTGAEAMLAQSQALWHALGDRRKAYARLRNRAQCWLHLGRADEALASFELCERAAREDDDWVGQIDSLLSLSSLLAARRQWAAALAIDQRCVALCWQRWHRHGLAYALWNPPRLLARLRRPEPAMRLMGFAATFWQTQFGPLSRADRQTVRRVTRLVQAQVGTARAGALWAEGAAMDIAQAVALALAD